MLVIGTCPSLVRLASVLLLIVSLGLIAGVAQRPTPKVAQKPTPKSGARRQEKRGLGVQPTPTPGEVQGRRAESVQSKPELVLQTGHSGRIGAVAFSRDGRLLASAGTGDKTVIVWDVASGRALRTLAHEAEDIAFSPDGRWLATAGGEVKLWELASGKLIHTLSGPKSYLHVVAFSPDSRHLAAAGTKVAGDSNGVVGIEVKVWKNATGVAIDSLSLSEERETTEVQEIAFSSDGSQVAAVSYRKFETLADRTAPRPYEVLRREFTYRLTAWDLEAGRELHSTLLASRVEKYQRVPIAFSSDKAWLAVGIPGGVKILNVATGTLKHEFDLQREMPETLVFSPDGRWLAAGASTTKIWDFNSGRELRTLETPANRSLGFSVDGRWLLTADYSAARIWDVDTGGLLYTVPTKDSGSIHFSPDGRRILGDSSERLTLWDTTKGLEAQELNAAGLNPVEHAVFSPDKRWLLTVAGGPRLWDLRTGTQARTFDVSGNVRGRRNFVFSDDGQWLAAGVFGDLRLWKVATGEEVLRRGSAARDRYAEEVSLSPDQRLLAASYSDRWSPKVVLYEAKTGKYLDVPGSGGPFLSKGTSLSPDARWWAVVPDSLEKDRTVELRELVTGRLVHTLDGPPSKIAEVVFSPDGRRLAGIEREYAKPVSGFKVWDVETGRLLAARPETRDFEEFSPNGTWMLLYDRESFAVRESASGREVCTFPGRGPNAVAWSVSRGWLMVSRIPESESVTLYDLATCRTLRTFTAHTARISTLALSPDERWLASASSDGTTRIWDVATGEEMASLVFLREPNSWLVTTPDGLFDGSPDSWAKILWRFGGNTFDVVPAEAFFNEFYYPGLLAEILAGKRPHAPRDIAQVDRRQPQVKLAVRDGQTATGPVTSRTVTVRVEVAEAPADAQRTAGSGARDVRLFRNGSLVKVWRGNLLPEPAAATGLRRSEARSRPKRPQTSPSMARSATLEATVPIVAGENRFTAYAFNHDNIKSSDATLTIAGAEGLKRKGIAYVLAVGVNEYANTQYNLKYAVADAQDFAEQLKLQQAKLNNYERVEVISLSDKDATKANILKSLADLSAKVQPEDALVIFFAGHGTAQQNRFYLIPHDLGYAGSRTALDSAGLQNILAHSISDEEISHAVEGIDAGQMLLVIDACNSGQALEAEEKRRGPMNSKGLAQLAYEKGMYILTAAQSYQAANEAERYGHGFLTYALVEEGLKTGAADKEPKDGQVLLREWLDFATERVPQMQQDKLDEQKKQGRQLEQVIKFAESDAGAQRSVQRPRVFYRREAETSPLVVAKP